MGNKKFKNRRLVIRERIVAFCLSSIVFFTISCDDMVDKVKPISTHTSTESTKLFVLSEGLFNMNNSTLATYDLTTQTMVTDFFLAANKRGLGDTANDMGLYGTKMWLVVNVSSQIEVIDVQTGKSLKRIAMFDSNKVAREPRFIDFYKGKAYVCAFDGTVTKIDTASLEIEAQIRCGKNPDGICVANNKLYVSNSGGLNFPNYDNTISVVDLNSFSELKKITVGINPGKLQVDNEGDVYVISRGNYGTHPSKLERISSVTDELVQSFEDLMVQNFSISNDTAYLYISDNGNQHSYFKVLDCKTEKIISENFITDSILITTPFGIDVNPTNGDVYITDAKSYTVWGDVLCFDKNGKLKFQLKEIGLNPKKILFN